MGTMNVSLPANMREYIEKEVKRVGFSTASEYIRNLVREDQRRSEQERFEALILEGLDSGEPIEINEDWKRRHKAELDRQAKKAGKIKQQTGAFNEKAHSPSSGSPAGYRQTIPVHKG